MHQFIDIPSCVPSVPGLEEAGASFDASVIDRLAKLPRVIGLAEVMDFLGVVDGEDRMMEIIDAAERNGLYLQGHLPAGFGRMVSAYRIGGPLTCHETGRPGEALDKLRAGMYVDARESSMCYNLPTIWEDVKDLLWRDRLSLCTDDREADDILENGQLDLVLRNNITTKEHPLGVYHPHEELHHIKKENIGLIEVMGLAILPARLQKELTALGEALVDGRDIRGDEVLGKHADWAEELTASYGSFRSDNVEQILREEIGKVFCRVLEDAGVYKCNEEGREAFRRFVRTLSL